MSDYQAAERNAPLQNNARPPAKCKTLKYVVQQWPELVWQYSALVTGDGYVRDFVNQDDPDVSALIEEIGAGNIVVLPAGETRASMAAKEGEREEFQRQYLAELKAGEARQAAERQREVEAKLAKVQEAQAAELARIAKSYAA